MSFSNYFGSLQGLAKSINNDLLDRRAERNAMKARTYPDSCFLSVIPMRDPDRNSMRENSRMHGVSPQGQLPRQRRRKA